MLAEWNPSPHELLAALDLRKFYPFQFARHTAAKLIPPRARFDIPNVAIFALKFQRVIIYRANINKH